MMLELNSNGAVLSIIMIGFVHVLTLSAGDYNFLFSKHSKQGLSFYPQQFELKEIAKR